MELTEKHGIIAISILVFLIIVLGIWYFLSKDPRVAEDNCPIENKYLAGQTYIIIDQTGKFTENQKRKLKSVLREFITDINKLKKYERLTIVPLTGKKINVLDQESKVFNLCRPKLGKNKSFAEATYQEKFNDPLKKIYNELFDAKGANATHLFDLIFEISNTPEMSSKRNFRNDFRRRIIIFSDMLHNNKQFSFYEFFKELPFIIDRSKCSLNKRMFELCEKAAKLSKKEIGTKTFDSNLTYDKARKDNPDYFDDKIKPRFTDDVKIALYILATDQQADKRWKIVRQFWMDYFQDNKLKFDIQNGRPIPCMTGGENYTDGCIWIEGSN